MLSQRFLHLLFTYNPETGYLSWVEGTRYFAANKNQRRIDFKSNGYLKTYLFGKIYPIEKLVWQYHNGYYPEKIIDHLNGIKYDNRIENLREASSAENARNCSLSNSNSSGVRGVSWYVSTSKWTASISYNYKHYYLGSSEDFIEAVYLRYTAEKCLDWESFKNQSTAYQYIKSLKYCTQIMKSLVLEESYA